MTSSVIRSRPKNIGHSLFSNGRNPGYGEGGSSGVNTSRDVSLSLNGRIHGAPVRPLAAVFSQFLTFCVQPTAAASIQSIRRLFADRCRRCLSPAICPRSMTAHGSGLRASARAEFRH